MMKPIDPEPGRELANQLRCTGGEIYASVFENASAGVKRGLYWHFHLDCAPVVLAGDDDGDDEDNGDDEDRNDDPEEDGEDHDDAPDEEWDAAFLCDWATWPIRGWTELDGMSLDRLVQPGMLEVSFYLSEHHDAKARVLELRRSEGARFHIRLEGEFTLQGFGALDAAPIEFAIEGELDFMGVFVIPNNLFPKPTTASEAKACVAPYLDTSALGKATWDRFRFVLAPIA
jgi:hypothetical protein